MSRVTFLAGGGVTIGRSFYRFMFGSRAVAFDCGGGYATDRSAPSGYLGPQYEGPIDDLFISHAHYDHCAYVPHFASRYPDMNIYASQPTVELARVTWRETIRLANQLGGWSPFSQEELTETTNRIKLISADTPVQLASDLTVYSVPAGHILGAMSFLVQYRGDWFFITNDISFTDRFLIPGAPPIGIDRCRALVRESTYINEGAGEDRLAVEARLVQTAKRILSNGGRVVIPSLSIDRVQDVYAVLKAADIPRTWPVYVAGSPYATKIYQKHLAITEQLLSGIQFLRRSELRDTLKKKIPAVFIASSGMLYPQTSSALAAQEILADGRSGILLVNWQDPCGQGMKLLDTARGNVVEFNSRLIRANCDIQKFDLSAHMSGTEGEELEARLNPDVVFCVHGESDKIDNYISRQSSSRTRIRPEEGREVPL